MRGDGKWGSSLVHKKKFIESLSYTNAPIKPQNHQFFKKEKKRKGKTHPQYYLQKCKEYEKESRDCELKKIKKKLENNHPQYYLQKCIESQESQETMNLVKKKKKSISTYVCV